MKRAGLSKHEDQAILDAVRANGLPDRAVGLNWEAIKQAMGLDKKVKDGKNVWVLTPGLGRALTSTGVNELDVEEAMERVLGNV
jgi:3-dehydroquinate synthetase